MDPLGTTSSVIAVATLAWQSSKAAYELVDRLIEAPAIITDSKHRLMETQNTLSLLQTLLKAPTQPRLLLDSLLEQFKLEESLDLTRTLCDDFQTRLRLYTQHADGSRSSNRDRFSVDFHQSMIPRFNTELGHCYLGMNTVLTSINLLLNQQVSDNIDGLSTSLVAQEKAVIATIRQLKEGQKSLTAESHEETHGGDSTAAPEDHGARLTEEPEKVCERVQNAIKAKRTGQTFGKMELDKSIGMQGIVGIAQQGVEQKFGDFKASNDSRGFQGQMDSNAFATLFN